MTLAVYGQGKEVCSIYVEELFGRYANGTPMEEIVNGVILELAEAKENKLLEKARYLMDYTKVKDSLIIRPVNKDREKEELGTALYRTVGDIALVLYLGLGLVDGRVASMKIREEYVEYWEKDCGITRDGIFDAALANTARLTPPRVYRWEKLLLDPSYEGEDVMGQEARLDKGMAGNCISVKGRANGAVAVFLPGVAKRLGELLEGDFVAAFTSVHEAMVHSVDTASIPEIGEVLRCTVEKSTPEEERLTFHVYRYCVETGEFICLPDRNED